MIGSEITPPDVRVNNTHGSSPYSVLMGEMTTKSDVFMLAGSFRAIV